MSATSGTSAPRAANVSRTSEQMCLRWSGYIGLTPLLLLLVSVGGRRFPWPNDNVEGGVYASYMLPHRTAEIQSVIGMGMVLGLLMWTAPLVVVYMRRAGRITLSTLTLICGSVLSLALFTVSIALYLGIVLFARGYPGFGSNPADHRMITLAWLLMNCCYFVGEIIRGVACIALVTANRATPVLPKSLGTWGAGVVAVVSILCSAFAFVATGLWSPGSTASLMIVEGVTLAWVLATSLWLLRATHRPDLANGPGRG
ncbi:hypothetical protein ACH427_27805 [Streptomyces sp. NPDC020379]|uniref:hypothetical protein n=1 Tax=Streptomyces sp. NPDC020379 TaxID=3365071 RepID=UPI0037BC57F7